MRHTVPKRGISVRSSVRYQSRRADAFKVRANITSGSFDEGYNSVTTLGLAPNITTHEQQPYWHW